ncbi:hypothetical protein PMI14_00771 [Acidovorax sp. CF316]|uniref:hypothetical protein n=1 Tax=Acidovorax sp. CF316 TaxID=1144317 RepID=UPI00026BC655|nr:hypothetical protein [Acidovorax sp. CF316]EJE54265.1 hypothetical protein PMI14_00771 [Acidovorax sp. CF316]
MHRRIFLAAGGRRLALGGLVLAAIRNARAQPAYTVSAEQLQEAVALRFPLRYPMAGLVDVDVQAPGLSLLPESNRLAAAFALSAAGPALRRRHSGTLEVEFALRYEPGDRSLRAHQLRVGRLDFPSLRPEVVALLNGYGPALAEQSLREVVLHRLRPQDLAVLDGLGMQPGAITVTAKGLSIAFVNKPAP